MRKSLFIIALFFVLSGCGTTATKPLGSGLRLEPGSFDNLANWHNDDLYHFSLALKNSCTAVNKISPAKPLTATSEIQITAEKMQNFCSVANGIKDDRELKQLITEYFTPYKVIYNNSDKGTFTGYYESALSGSRTKTKEYLYPIYATPKDLVKINPKDFGINSKEELVGVVKNQEVKPYPERKELQNKVDATPLLWFKSKVDVFFLHIQGSAKVKLTDGSITKIGYAQNNGRKFVGIGKVMQEEGLIKGDKSSMQDIRAWLKANPKKADEIMNKNPRYIFFRELKGIDPNQGPLGAQGVPLIAERSLAVDKEFLPLGSLLWLEIKDGYDRDIHKLVIAQDTGGAIKGGVRGDFYWGTGEDALRYAGNMKTKGSYYILLPK